MKSKEIRLLKFVANNTKNALNPIRFCSLNVGSRAGCRSGGPVILLTITSRFCGVLCMKALSKNSLSRLLWFITNARHSVLTTDLEINREIRKVFSSPPSLVENVRWPFNNQELFLFLHIFLNLPLSHRSVGTFARALDCSSSVRQPSLHMSAAAASRDITLVRCMDVGLG